MSSGRRVKYVIQKLSILHSRLICLLVTHDAVMSENDDPKSTEGRHVNHRNLLLSCGGMLFLTTRTLLFDTRSLLRDDVLLGNRRHWKIGIETICRKEVLHVRGDVFGNVLGFVLPRADN